MLDQDIKNQLSEVFAKLNQTIELVHHQGSSEAHLELLQMLEDIASCSPKIKVRISGSVSASPSFHLATQGRPNGIFFRGIPGGHEFTSLILAILNSDGQGKMPDPGLALRIKNLKGPIRIKTYISLTCENCPEVVQALNQMALLHPDFHHEMVDGSYAPDEISKLNIQGVPSLIHESKLLHSGRIHFLDLLSKLETEFGSQNKNESNSNSDLGHYDVVVVGGGPAGVSAAIYSVRKGLKTALLAERMGGQVQDTKGIENLVSVLYTEGPKLSEDLQKHLASYPVQILERRRVKHIGKDRHILLEGGEHLSADAVIVATGAKWRELGVPGEKEYVGRGVAYCPHCDGPFYKNKKIAVIGGGNSGIEAAIDLAGIAGNVVVLEFADSLKADQVLIDKLKSLNNTSIITSAKSTELIGDGQKIIALEYLDRKTEKLNRLEIDGVFIQIGLLPNSSFIRETVELSKFGEIITDLKGHTNVPGIYAAGDVTTIPFKQIIIAMGEGAKVALTAFEDRMYQSPNHPT